MKVRLIQPEDNLQIRSVIRNVLKSFGADREGFAWADPELDYMFNAFSGEGKKYWVITDGSKVYGGGGVGPLKDGPKGWCELQKMYFDKAARGRGFGKQILKQCLDFAKMNYSNCYLETLHHMHEAQSLYAKFGFEKVSKPLGSTGHSGCDVWMVKKLT